MFNTITRAAGVLLIGGATAFGVYSFAKNRGDAEVPAVERRAPEPQNAAGDANADARPTEAQNTDAEDADLLSSGPVADPYDEERLAELGAGGILGTDTDAASVQRELTQSTSGRSAADRILARAGGEATGVADEPLELAPTQVDSITDNAIADTADDVSTEVETAAADAAESVETKVATIQNTNRGTLRGAPTTVSETVEDTADGVVNDAMTQVDDVATAARDAGADLADNVTDAAASAEDFATSAATAASDVAALPQTLTDVAERGLAGTSQAEVLARPASDNLAEDAAEDTSAAAPTAIASSATPSTQAGDLASDGPAVRPAPTMAADDTLPSSGTPVDTPAAPVRLASATPSIDKPDQGTYFTAAAPSSARPGFTANKVTADKPDDGGYFTARDSGAQTDPCVKADGTPYIGPGSALNPFASDSPCLPQATADGYEVASSSNEVATATSYDVSRSEFQNVNLIAPPIGTPFRSDYSSSI